MLLTQSEMEAKRLSHSSIRLNQMSRCRRGGAFSWRSYAGTEYSILRLRSKWRRTRGDGASQCKAANPSRQVTAIAPTDAGFHQCGGLHFPLLTTRQYLATYLVVFIILFLELVLHSCPEYGVLTFFGGRHSGILQCSHTTAVLHWGWRFFYLKRKFAREDFQTFSDLQLWNFWQVRTIKSGC